MAHASRATDPTNALTLSGTPPFSPARGSAGQDATSARHALPTCPNIARSIPSSRGSTPRSKTSTSSLHSASPGASNVIAIASAFARDGHYVGHEWDLLSYGSRMLRARHVLICLITEETNVNAANNRGFTPLMIACGAGEHAVHSFVDGEDSTKEARRILMRDKRIDINLSDNDGRTALHHACQRSDLVAVRQLSLAPTINIHVKDARGRTPLHTACDIKQLVPYFRSQRFSETCMKQHKSVVSLLMVDSNTIGQDTDGLSIADMLHDETPFPLDVGTEERAFLSSLRLKILACSVEFVERAGNMGVNVIHI